MKIVKNIYNEYKEAKSWLHHHTIVVATWIIVFVLLCVSHFWSYDVWNTKAYASWPVVDMSISNTPYPEEASLNEIVSFFYFYQRESGSAPGQVNIVADIPPQMSFVNADRQPDQITSTQLRWNNVPITNDDYGFLIVQMQIVDDSQSTITHNVALELPMNTDNITNNNDQDAVITINSDVILPPESSDIFLSVEKEAPEVIFAGEEITYTITYTNSWTDTAQNVIIEDIIPWGTVLTNGTALLSVESTPAYNSSLSDESQWLYVWEIPSIWPWQSGVIEVSGTVSPWLEWHILVNQANIQYGWLQQWSDYVLTQVLTQWAANIGVTKDVDITSANIGDTVTYTIVVKNISLTQWAEDTVLVWAFPSNINVMSSSDISVDANNQYQINIGSVPPLSQVVYIVEAEITGWSSVIESCASVSTSTFDPDSENDNDCSQEIALSSDWWPWDDDPIYGCTDSAYDNYDPNATDDDGTCANNESWDDDDDDSSQGGSTNQWWSSTSWEWNTQQGNTQDTAQEHSVSTGASEITWVGCVYTDVDYFARWAFTDTINHRGFDYIEIMRLSCLHRGVGSDQWLWIYLPERDVTRAEVLKTIVKVLWAALWDFDIQTEDAYYPFAVQFEDVPWDHRFAWYANYAKNKWLTDGMAEIRGNGQRYLYPDAPATRYEVIWTIMKAYNIINDQKIDVQEWSSVLGDVIDKSNPYYTSVRQAETLWFVSWIPQVDGSYSFKWQNYTTRAEFAKMVALPFGPQLFDMEKIILESNLYKTIVESLENIQTDPFVFIHTTFTKLNLIPDREFLRQFKVHKPIFLDALRTYVLEPLLEENK